MILRALSCDNELKEYPKVHNFTNLNKKPYFNTASRPTFNRSFSGGNTNSRSSSSTGHRTPRFNKEKLGGVKYNEFIWAKEVRLIDEDGGQLGIMSIDEARRIAEEKELDLIEVGPNANPAIVKITDIGKYAYEIQKKKKNNKTQNSELKQIWLTLRIGDNDLDIKLKKVRGFIEDKDKVRIIVKLRGREIAHNQLATLLIQRVCDKIKEVAELEGNIQNAGRNVSATFKPISKK